MYLNLLFRALKADKEIKRVMAFVKRLCQMFGLAGVPFLSGALYLLGEVSRDRSCVYFLPNSRRVVAEYGNLGADTA